VGVTLWHISISHYSEKVRWALAYKGVEHERKAPPPGAHMAVALALTRGRQKTFPVLALNGDRVGDSTAIIAALEERYPDPPLYPADTGERRRALALEDWFDEELGPHMRLLGWHEVTRDPERLGRVASTIGPAWMAGLGSLPSKVASGFVGLRFGVHSDEAADYARVKIERAFDRLESELGDEEYLVGGRFSVADLTAAALFYPLVIPPEGPQLIADPPPSLAAFRDRFADRDGFRYVQRMFSRHR
jgi:glutathione S-transferase